MSLSALITYTHRTGPGQGQGTEWSHLKSMIPCPCVVCTVPKNIDRGRNSSCYIALCAKSVGNFTTVTDRQLFGFGNLWFYTFIKNLCLEKCYSIYLVKIIQQSIHKMWKKQQHYFIAKPMEVVLVTHRQCMTPVAAGNTNPVTLISYSFVCLGQYIA